MLNIFLPKNAKFHHYVMLLWALSLMLFCASCGAGNDRQSDDNGKTKVMILGMIHGGHVEGGDYPLSLVKNVTMAYNPDIILTELPAQSYQEALSGYAENGKVTQKRALDFPEYRDLLIPLAFKRGYQIIGTAGWTPAIADQRKKALAALKNAPENRKIWDAWLQSDQEFIRQMGDRWNDPLFIHKDDYDAMIASHYQLYMRELDPFLGDGGWKNINAAHVAHIEKSLDDARGQGKTVLITFGAYHIYMIKAALEKRDDIIWVDPVPYLKKAGAEK